MVFGLNIFEVSLTHIDEGVIAGCLFPCVLILEDMAADRLFKLILCPAGSDHLSLTTIRYRHRSADRKQLVVPELNHNEVRAEGLYLDDFNLGALGNGDGDAEVLIIHRCGSFALN